jgi:hypothetical protein
MKIKREDVYWVEYLSKSPFDVPGLDTGITRQEVIDSIRESRERDPNNRHVDN